MPHIIAQASFNSGEWSPNLFARVDLAKYKAGAALLENFFVDYRGGASTRVGTRYILQAYKSATSVRLISFQASFTVGYVLEFGDGYIRFFYRGSPIIETGVAITAATKANPCVLTIPGHTYSIGDWIYVQNVGGMTQINQKYFIITAVAGNNVTIAGLNGTNINSTGYSTYTSGGTASRVYTIASPYTSSDDLRLIKFAQSVNQMILCHPNHAPYVLTLISATNWTLVPVVIGATISAPGTPTLAGSFVYFPGATPTNYSYGVTSIGTNGQESSMSAAASLYTYDMRTVTGTVKASWTAVQGAIAYNVYKTQVSYFGVLPVGVQYGFVGTCKDVNFIDSNIAADFTQTPPISKNPFVGSGIDHVTVTTPGTYTTVPTVSFGGSPTIAATAIAVLQVQSVPTISAGGAGYTIGDTVNFGSSLVMLVTNVAAGVITAWSVQSPGYISSGSVPTNPFNQINTSGSGTGAQISATWGVGQVVVTGAGAGFGSAPSVIFSTGAATATAYLGATSNGVPTVPGFVQQRLFLGGLLGAPQSFYLSRPGSYFNFDISQPSRADDAISATLVSGTLNNIKAVIPSNSGMLVLTDKASWVVNGGTAGAALTPSSLNANPQSFVGASDVPPIVANYDILYVQSKGSAIRDLAFNIYFNTFTGTDISTLASHLFYSYTIDEWCWAEQPFYNVNAIRNDGTMLTLTFLKEQEFVGWSHYTTNGLFKSVASVTEPTDHAGTVDAVYTVVQRTVGGNAVQYIERFAERAFPAGVADAWCVDAGLGYEGSPATNFSGGEHLAGLTVTGLADGFVIPSFVMPANGEFTLSVAASKVTIGLGYTCKLQTLAIDTGDGAIQGKLKRVVFVDVRVKDALNLWAGSSFNRLVQIKDLVVGNVSSMLTGQDNQIITGLVTGDARITMDPTYTIPGQICIQQNDPIPATVLGLFTTLELEGGR